MPKANVNCLINCTQDPSNSGPAPACQSHPGPRIPEAEPRPGTPILQLKPTHGCDVTVPHNRARAIKIEQYFLNCFWPILLWEMDSSAEASKMKCQDPNCKWWVCYSKFMDAFWPANYIKTYFCILFKITVIKPNAVDFRACREPSEVTVLKYLLLNNLNSIFTYT